MSRGPMRVWIRRVERSLVGTGVLIATLSVAPVAAQSSAANARADLITYVIDADGRPAFETIIDALLTRLKTGSVDHALTPIDLRVFRMSQAEPSGGIKYLLLIEPPLAGPQTLEQLIADVWPVDEAARVIEQLRKATGNEAASQASLEMIQSISPLDVLRARLEADLATTLAPITANGEPTREDAARLDQLKGVLWAVDDVRYEVTENTSRGSRVRWSIQVRNPSLLQPLFANVSIEFRDKDGRTVATGAPVVIQLDPVTSRSLSGEIGLPTDAVLRIITASAKVDVQR